MKISEFINPNKLANSKLAKEMNNTTATTLIKALLDDEYGITVEAFEILSGVISDTEHTEATELLTRVRCTEGRVYLPKNDEVEA